MLLLKIPKIEVFMCPILLYAITFLISTWAKLASEPYIIIAQLLTFYYFFYLIFLIPIVGIVGSNRSQ
jgi:hypothetical protein